MKYIANVVSKSKTYRFVPWINVSNTLEDIDMSVPTLIIGTDVARSYLGSDINYINRKVSQNVSWTYKVTEKRSTNEEDVKNFKENVISFLKKKINFTNFNALIADINQVKSFLSFLEEKDVCYVVGEHNIYIAYDDNVIGISFDDLEYIGVKKDKIITRIAKLKNNKISIQKFIKDFDSEFFKNDEILIAAMFCYLNS